MSPADSPSNLPTSPEEEPFDEETPQTGKFLGRSFCALLGGVFVFYGLAFTLHAAVILVGFPEEAALMAEGREDQVAPADQAEEPSAPAVPKRAAPDQDDSAETETETEPATADLPEAEEPPAEPHEPTSWFWLGGLAAYILAGWIAGWVAARFAPASPLGHGVLIAAFLFLTALQENGEALFPRPPWVLALFTFVVPAMALWGAFVSAKRWQSPFFRHEATRDSEHEPCSGDSEPSAAQPSPTEVPGSEVSGSEDTTRS